MGDPVLLVAGLGRCGTSLVMQMLDAAGVPVAGQSPAYEDIPVSVRFVDLDWLDRQRGRAVKWIDPVNAKIVNPEDWRYRVIFLSRDAQQQALSQMKLLGLSGDRALRRIWRAKIERDRTRALRIVDRLCGAHGTLHLRFEDLITHPVSSADRIARFCDAHGFPFGNTFCAAGKVLPRHPACAPDMRIDLALMRCADARAVAQ